MKTPATVLTVALLSLLGTQVAQAAVGDRESYEISPGDFDNDGRYTEADLMVVVRLVFEGHQPHGILLHALDVNGDRQIDPNDAYELAVRVYWGHRPEPTKISFVRGDVTGDGIVDEKDADRLERALKGNVTTSGPLDAADANEDRKIDRRDLQLLQEHKPKG